MTTPVRSAVTVTKDSANGTTTKTVSYRPTHTDGARIWCAFAVDSGTTITTPTGWTALKASQAYGSQTFGLFYRDDGSASLGGTTFTVTVGAAQDFVAAVWETTGHAATAPEVSADATLSSNNAPNPASLTWSWGAADTLVTALIWSGATDGTTVISTFPSGYSNTGQDNSGASGAVLIGWGDKASTGTSEDPGAGALNQNQTWLALTVAEKGATPSNVQRIRPATILRAGSATVSGSGSVA